MSLSIAFVLALLVCAVTGRNGCPKLKTKERFDVKEYAGTWYEIERIPSDIERGLKCGVANHTLVGDHFVFSLQGMKKNGKPKTVKGKATVPHKNRPGKLLVRLDAFPIDIDYWVLDTDYKEYAVVYSCNPSFFSFTPTEYLWIFSRTRTLDPATSKKIYEFLDEIEVDRTKLRKANQQNCK